MDTSTVVSIALLILVATLAMGMVRAVRGPTLQDRMTAVQLTGTGGVAVLLLLGHLLERPALLDVALLLALLATVAVAALTRQESVDD